MSKEREQYYQSITRRLFSLRGSPFFLSAREMEIIESWESQDIPLSTVLEGIKRGYEAYRIRKAGHGRKFSLLNCQSQVRQTFDLYRERTVGGRESIREPVDKYGQIQASVKVFLKDLPIPLLSLKEIYQQALVLLSREEGSDSLLEELDEKIERQLFQMASEVERGKLKLEIQLQHGITEPEELERLVRIQWIKSMRDLYQVPFLAPYYY